MDGDLISRVDFLFSLDPQGFLVRKVTLASNARAGQKAGSLDGDYYKVKIDGKSYLVHRIIFLMVNGYLPDLVDHVNGDTTDNRPCNLREATKAQNRWNCLGNEGSISGVKGVYFDKGRWKALLNFKGDRYYLGMFSTKEAAGEVVRRKYEELHKDFYRDVEVYN